MFCKSAHKTQSPKYRYYKNYDNKWIVEKNYSTNGDKWEIAAGGTAIFTSGTAAEAFVNECLRIHNFKPEYKYIT